MIIMITIYLVPLFGADSVCFLKNNYYLVLGHPGWQQTQNTINK